MEEQSNKVTAQDQNAWRLDCRQKALETDGQVELLTAHQDWRRRRHVA